MSSPRAWRPLIAVALGAFTLTSCFTGQRPRFEDDVPGEGATGNAEIDAVLNRLDGVGGSLLTADYQIYAANGETSPATVVLAEAGRRSITVDKIRYLIDGGSGITCNLSSAECEASLNDARISNLQLTHEFYAPAFARRLRVDANRRIQDPTGYTEQIDGQQAACVLLPVTGGEKTYCALDSGVLARYIGPDAEIELISVSPETDEADFSTS